MSFKDGETCKHPSCMTDTPCEGCGRTNGRYTLAVKGEYETELHYVERLLQALMKDMSIKGILLAFRTKSGTDILTSVGQPPHLVMADDETWSEFIR